MTKFNSHGAVSIAILIAYIPAIIAAAIVCFRHGFSKSSGFVFTLILCAIRIIGAICQLATYHDSSSGLLTITLILETLGITPLLQATLGMLSRLVDQTNARNQHVLLTVKHFRLLHLLITVAMILAIAGSTGNDNTTKVSGTLKGGVCLFVGAYVAMIITFLIASPSLRLIKTRERFVAIAIVVAAPFISVRLLYSILAVFVHNHNFSTLTGSVPVRVGMATIEEYIVVLIYVGLGFILHQLAPEQQGPIESRPWKAPKDERSRRHSSRRDGLPAPENIQYKTHPVQYPPRSA